MKISIKRGTTSYILSVFISDSSSTTGAGLASLVFNTAGLTAKYKRQGEAGWSTLSLVTAVEGTWTTLGFIEDDVALGNYEVGIPDTVIAAGAGVEWVRLMLYGAANMAPLPIEIQLVNNVVSDVIDANGRVDVGLWLGTAVNEDAAGYPKVTVKAGTGTGELSLSSGLVNITQAAADKVWSTAARTLTSFGTLIQDIWDKATSALTTGSSIGKLLVDDLALIVEDTNELQTDWKNGGRLDLLLDAVKAVTDNLPDGGALNDLATLTSRLTAARAGYLDNLSAGAVALASVCTEARLAELASGNIPADVDTLLSRLSAARGGYLDNLSAGAVALEASLTAMKGGGWSSETLVSIEAAILALNNLSAASIETACDVSLVTYDGPTKAEMDSAHGLLATPAQVNEQVGAVLNTAIPGSPTADSVNEALQNQAKAAGTIVEGAAAAGTLSTTEMTTTLTETTNAHYNGRTIIWTSGVLQNQATDITNYDGSTKKLTFTAVTESPGAGNTFVIV